MIMDKGGLTILIFALITALLAINASALTVEMKDSYLQRETGLAKISGNFDSISKTDVAFYRGHVFVSSFDYDIVKIGYDYYVWFVTPLTENNYTLQIEKIGLMKNFSVGNDSRDYYIKPGAILSNEDFSIDVFSNLDSVKNIDISYIGVKSYAISPGGNKIDFSLNEITSTKTIDIIIGDYKIPAYLIKPAGIVEENDTNATVQNTEINALVLTPKQIDREEVMGSHPSYIIEIANSANQSIKNILVEYNSKVVKLNQTIIEEISANGKLDINLSILTTMNVSEIINFKNGNESLSLPVIINFVNQGNALNATNQSGFYDCVLELNGTVCLPSETCTRESRASKQGTCCLGQCALPNNSSGGSPWMGWLIAAIVLGIIGFIYYKYKAVKPAKNPIEKQVGEIEKKGVSFVKE